MELFLWSGLMFGLLGSVHCAGMCGPIVLALPGGKTGKADLIIGRSLYSLGRVLTYMLLGLAVGLLGSGVSLAGYQQILSIVTGVAILIIAVFPKGKFNKFMHFSPALFNKVFGPSFNSFIRNGSKSSLFGIGFLNGFLPCGFVYMALIASLGAGSLAGSIGFMGMFGLGTVPLLFMMAIAPGYLSLNVREKIKGLLPVAAGVLGVLLILRGLSLGIPFISPVLGVDIAGTEACH